MPPGLKDINLDKWLINNDRRTKFKEILNMVLEKVEEYLTDKVMKIIDILIQKIE
ncbi:hypothetical protein H1Z61_00060 [Bacillus aquiflavi]|uniref:Uncharacterized protein n=1 Tax=Bacillus aquiflavi TaxID=2672567 RepID=A0A6B3VRZ4_9BACI|nr:hypothetical protein [Bacillus aquiflavi]MBA4535562.1 hypothetical protein [Bacillus aquiflavi]NEY79938.1 hypothetical protein [Bacillus aquiflavi]UAC48882.1 hypothetical protein K6959_02890 [Bacillus aquiflavi]